MTFKEILCLNSTSPLYFLYLVCPNGTYGDKCEKTCQCATDNTVSCDVMTGSCTCKDGWAGDTCSVDIDECSNPDIHRCPVGTQCQNKQGSFDCLCKQGIYEGCPRKS